MIKIIEDNNIIYAKIIRASYEIKEAEFFTKETDEIQIGAINYQKGYKTGAHCHNHTKRKTTQTDEILIFQEGSARIDFYNDKGVYLKSIEAFKGDIVIIFKGGHNVVFLEDSKIYMIKSGVYDKNSDATRIIGANNIELKIDED